MQIQEQVCKCGHTADEHEHGNGPCNARDGVVHCICYQFAKREPLEKPTAEEFERISRKPRAYYVPHIPNGEVFGHPTDFYPGIAVQGESGYYVTNWNWGKDRALAQACADELNAKLGLSKEEAERIICSSMFSKRRGR